MNNQLDIVVSVPYEYTNKTKGLLGVFNGNPLDDLLTPSGKTLSTNSTEKIIFYEFGEKC